MMGDNNGCTHERLAPSRVNQYNLAWPTYNAPTSTFEPYLH